MAEAVAKKHLPTRMCLGCRAKNPKHTLQRFVLKEHRYQVDKAQSKQARGYYFCSNECLQTYQSRNKSKF